MLAEESFTIRINRNRRNIFDSVLEIFHLALSTRKQAKMSAKILTDKKIS